MRDLPQLYLTTYLGTVFIAALSRMLLKRAVMRPRRSFVEEYLNPQVVFAYGLLFLATLIGAVAYRKIPLSLSPILETSACLYMLISGAMFSGERITRRKPLAFTLILGGIVLLTLSV